MKLEERINAFTRLGGKIDNLSNKERETIHQHVARSNPWFTPDSINLSLSGITYLLKENNLTRWVKSYSESTKKNIKIGMAMAGNIPLVGFHDYLCVLLSGHQAVIKLSTQDAYLLPVIHAWLIELEPRFKDSVHFEERLKNIDGMIATGSDNTARYFEFYFRKIPHIIRKNRSSVAIIMGEEEKPQLKDLAQDVFSYFGLGCRNVSKLFVPEGYEFNNLFESWEDYKEIIHHHKYANNYDYQKSILLMNKTPHLDNGFILLTQNNQLVSPISVVYFETYTTLSDLKKKLLAQRNKIQCMVSAHGWYKESVPFGKAQFPELADYSDGVDTMKFLSEIN